MATDKSEPKIGLIVKIALGAIVFLVATRQVLISYFHHYEDTLKSDNIVGSKLPDLTMVRANEKSLMGSPLPITNAMQMASTTDRMKLTGVEPQHPLDGGPDDMGAVRECWTKLPCDAGAPLVATGTSSSTDVDAGSAVDAADAATNALDDGGPKATDVDGGGAKTVADAGGPHKAPKTGVPVPPP